MFSRNRLPNFLASREWKEDCAHLVKWLRDHFDSLERKDALAINETASWTPADASGAGLALTVTTAKIAVGLGRVYGRLEIAYPVTANGANSAISGLPFAISGNVACPMLCTAAGGYTIALATGSGFLPATAAGARVTNAQLSAATIYISFDYDIA